MPVGTLSSRTMRTLSALVVSLALLQAAASEEKSCSAVLFDGRPHNEQLLRSGLYKPSSLAVDHKRNALYFSYIPITDRVKYEIAKVDLNTGSFGHVNVDSGYSLAVDQKRHLAYIGTHKGIYKYDSSTNKARLVLPAVTAWKLYFKDALYYIEFVSQALYKYVDGKSTLFEDLAGTKVYYFAIDDDYMVYCDDIGVFGKSRGSSDTVLYAEVRSVNEVREIALDKKGRFFVCFDDGIYRVDKDEQALRKVADVKGAYGMTFDADSQLIYSTENEVVRLVPNNDC
ncbi:unnamed protein product, partial [Iphiclides podalirius]